MKKRNRTFVSRGITVFGLLLFLMLIVPCAYSEEGQSAKKKQQAQGYEKILKYLPEDMRGKVRLPTEEEREALSILWPTVPVHRNAAYYYARAIYFMSKDEPPPGAYSGWSGYNGDVFAMAEWVRKNRKALTEVKKALKMKTCQFPLLIHNEWGNVTMANVYFSGLRELARICTDAGFFYEVKANDDYAAGWYLACIKIATQMGKDTTVLGNLVSLAISDMGQRNLHALIAHSTLSKRTLRQIIAECERAKTTPKERMRAFENEACISAFQTADEEKTRARIKLFIERFGSDSDTVTNNEEPDIFEDIFEEIVAIDKKILNMSHEEFVEYRANIQTIYGILEEIARKPLPELLQPAFEVEPLIPEELRTDVLEMYYSTTKLWFNGHGRSDFHLGALQIQAALALYYKDHKKLPDKLSYLHPRYLSKLPRDPFSGEPLKYKRTRGGWIVYSVGEDGKDDGGIGDPDVPPCGPDLVYESSIKSNIQRRSEWGKRFSSEGEADTR